MDAHLQRGVLLQELLGQVFGLVFRFLLYSQLAHSLSHHSQWHCEVVRDMLFKSTIAKSDPEVIMACDMTNPNPRAPPVTMVTLFSNENWFRVRLKRMPLIVGE